MFEIDDRELEAVRRVFEKRRLFRYQGHEPGECDLFEKEFAEHLRTEHALMVSSGTNALVAALGAAGIGPGDEVIIPSYTFAATATACLQVGAVPIVAQIDDQLGLSAADARRKITPKTKALIPVHMDGLAADLEGLQSLAREKNLALIEDAAQALGGSYRGRRLGTWGDLGCFSLNENKNISCGEGGIVVTSKRALFERAFCMHDSAAQFNPVKKELFKETAPFAGNSMRVSEISGAIMRVQLTRLEPILERLRERKRILKAAVSSTVRVITGHCEDGDCASSLHLLFPSPDRALLAAKSLREQGLLFVSPTTRPAHASWKWSKLLQGRTSQEFSTARFVESIDLLSRTLKLDLNPNEDLAITRQNAEKIAKGTSSQSGM